MIGPGNPGRQECVCKTNIHVCLANGLAAFRCGRFRRTAEWFGKGCVLQREVHLDRRQPSPRAQGATPGLRNQNIVSLEDQTALCPTPSESKPCIKCTTHEVANRNENGAKRGIQKGDLGSRSRDGPISISHGPRLRCAPLFPASADLHSPAVAWSWAEEKQLLFGSRILKPTGPPPLTAFLTFISRQRYRFEDINPHTVGSLTIPRASIKRV